MADRTLIGWSDATWNIITGCSRVSRGCGGPDGGGCYAERLAATRLRWHPSRRGLTDAHGRWTGGVRLNHQWIDQPLRWTRPRRIFVCAHGDLFHEAVPDSWLDAVMAVMARAGRHTFQVLTKRPERAGRYLRRLMRRDSWPYPNVWIGTSVEDQGTADWRIPVLLGTPAAVRWISAEPLLGPITVAERFLPECHCGDCRADHPEDGPCVHNGRVSDLTHGFRDCERYRQARPALDWVVAGGESGPRARPMDPGWVRSLRDQCVGAGVPFYFKQWGGPTAMAGGRILDGRTWDGMPEGARA